MSYVWLWCCPHFLCIFIYSMLFYSIHEVALVCIVHISPARWCLGACSWQEHFNRSIFCQMIVSSQLTTYPGLRFTFVFPHKQTQGELFCRKPEERNLVNTKITINDRGRMQHHNVAQTGIQSWHSTVFTTTRYYY